MIHGKCHCGEITFTAEEVSMKAGLICHCTTCRTMTSSFSYNLQASAQSIKINHGQPKVYEDKSSDSGKPVYRNFCGDCGTALFSRLAVVPDGAMIKVGCIQESGSVELQSEVYVERALEGLGLSKAGNHKNMKSFEGMMKKEV